MEHKTLTAVVVDDTPILRLTTSSVLERIGLNVIFQANDGADLVEKLGSVNAMPDICLLDLEMPGMNGIEAAKIVKNDWPNLKILGYSSCTDEIMIINMIKSGADGFLSKNCSIDELRCAIMHMIEHGHYFDDIASISIIHYLRYLKPVA